MSTGKKELQFGPGGRGQPTLGGLGQPTLGDLGQLTLGGLGQPTFGGRLVVASSPGLPSF